MRANLKSIEKRSQIIPNNTLFSSNVPPPPTKKKNYENKKYKFLSIEKRAENN